jgi:hypothetical protein
MKNSSFLIIGIMYNKTNSNILQNILTKLELEFGEIHQKTKDFDFSFTNFYEREFGCCLKKTYLCFEAFDLGKLAEAKLFCHELEKKFNFNTKRQFNIDPGYVTKNQVVLASLKPRAHRIYLDTGVYADLQLVFENGKWKVFQWTFPDILHPKTMEFLAEVRNRIG